MYAAVPVYVNCGSLGHLYGPSLNLTEAFLDCTYSLMHRQNLSNVVVGEKKWHMTGSFRRSL
jgi:hypothetical protein